MEQYIEVNINNVVINILQGSEITETLSGGLNTGWPNKNRTFLRDHIFAATTDIIMWFVLKR